MAPSASVQVMANMKHLAVLQKGVDAWNEWRVGNANEPNLVGADFRSARLQHANLSKADLSEADLTEADLRGANLRNACLREATLARANLEGADLCGAYIGMAELRQANLVKVNLCGAQCYEADFSNADLTGASLNGTLFSTANLAGTNLIDADLRGAVLARTSLEGARLINCRVYGASVWDVNLSGAIQKNLVITADDEHSITVDDLATAQFIYFLLHNAAIRRVIETITSKVVLILGRFTPERKSILDAIRQEVRQRDYVPVLVDFDKPSNRDLTETVSMLANMAKFVIADLTDARSLPQELAAIVPSLPSVPVQPILLASEREWGMYEHFSRYPWVLDIVRYETAAELLANLAERVIGPPERWLIDSKDR
jgi:uncharacterized protein YjbI with pentapeptide repeats